MKNYKELKKIIKLLAEKMGHVNSRAGRGYGTSSPELVKSDRMMLGHVNNVDDLTTDDDSGPVKVSRAFNNISQK